MNKQKIKKLKWLLDFMYLDAERLSTGERAKIYTELDEIAFDTQKFFWTEAAIEELQKRGKKIDKSSAASLITPYEDLPQDQLIEDFQKLQEKFKKLLRNFLDDKKQVFVCGNGGSAANAIHLANDLLYGIAQKHECTGMKIHALPSNQSITTCLPLSFRSPFTIALSASG